MRYYLILYSIIIVLFIGGTTYLAFALPKQIKRVADQRAEVARLNQETVSVLDAREQLASFYKKYGKLDDAIMSRQNFVLFLAQSAGRNNITIVNLPSAEQLTLNEQGQASLTLATTAPNATNLQAFIKGLEEREKALTVTKLSQRSSDLATGSVEGTIELTVFLK